MTPPSPYRERVVARATLQTAVPFVTVMTLWLAARGLVGWPPPHCREGFRRGSASGPHACFPGHRPTPGRVPNRECSTFAPLGAPHSSCCSTSTAPTRRRAGGLDARTLPSVTGIPTGSRREDSKVSKGIECWTATSKGPSTCLVHDPPSHLQPPEAPLLVKGFDRPRNPWASVPA